MCSGRNEEHDVTVYYSIILVAKNYTILIKNKTILTHLREPLGFFGFISLDSFRFEYLSAI